jgi:hypothetical protein
LHRTAATKSAGVRGSISASRPSRVGTRGVGQRLVDRGVLELETDLGVTSQLHLFDPTPAEGPSITSADARMTAIAREKDVVIFDRSLGRRTAVLAGAGTFVEGAFSADGTRLATSRDGKLAIWDVSQAKHVVDIDAPGAAQPAFSADGTRIAFHVPHEARPISYEVTVVDQTGKRITHTRHSRLAAPFANAGHAELRGHGRRVAGDAALQRASREDGPGLQSERDAHDRADDLLRAHRRCAERSHHDAALVRAPLRKQSARSWIRADSPRTSTCRTFPIAIRTATRSCA